MNYVTHNLDHILVVWCWGTGPLGLYARAYQLLLAPVQQIYTPVTGVAISTLARLQDSPERFRRYIRKGTLLLASIAIPLAGFMLPAADELVLTVLGPQWSGCAAIFRILVPVALLSSFNIAAGWACVSLGQSRRLFRFEIIAAIVFAVAFVAGVPWGPVGVAAACSITYCVLRPMGIAYCLKPTCLEVSDLSQALYRPGLATAVACLLLFAVGEIAPPPGGVLLELVVDLLVFAAAYGVGWFIQANGLEAGREMIRLLAVLRQSPQRSS